MFGTQSAAAKRNGRNAVGGEKFHFVICKTSLRTDDQRDFAGNIGGQGGGSRRMTDIGTPVADDTGQFIFGEWFEKLMKMRDMAPADISKLIRNQELDDAPLKNRKKL